MAKKKFPEIKEKNQDKFTRWVENNMSGKTTCKAASVIVNKNKEEEKKGIKPNKRTYKPAVLKMANYANNFGCKNEGKSKGPTAEDVTGDGKYTKKDFLVNIGVLNPDGSKAKKKDDNENKGNKKGKGPKRMKKKK